MATTAKWNKPPESLAKQANMLTLLVDLPKLTDSLGKKSHVETLYVHT